MGKNSVHTGATYGSQETAVPPPRSCFLATYALLHGRGCLCCRSGWSLSPFTLRVEHYDWRQREQMA